MLRFYRITSSVYPMSLTLCNDRGKDLLRVGTPEVHERSRSESRPLLMSLGVTTPDITDSITILTDPRRTNGGVTSLF